MRNRRMMFALLALTLLVVAVRHPTADLRVITHRASDPAPQQVHAAVDLGVMAFSLLITWTAKRFA